MRTSGAFGTVRENDRLWLCKFHQSGADPSDVCIPSLHLLLVIIESSIHVMSFKYPLLLRCKLGVAFEKFTLVKCPPFV
jgi:hypothetical protein